MTEVLAATGAPITAIEIDAPLVRRLQHLMQQFPNLDVISSDVLKVDIAEIAAGQRVRIYGNLPYYITSPILHHLFACASIINEIHIVVQLEVADRLAAQPGGRDYGYLSVATQLYSRPELVLKIPREAFEPPPEVASALVTLRLPGQAPVLGNIDKEQLLDFVKLCFAQKRKTLVNNLKSLGKADQVRGALERCGVRPDARAEQLTLVEFAQLARELGAVGSGVALLEQAEILVMEDDLADGLPDEEIADEELAYQEMAEEDLADDSTDVASADVDVAEGIDAAVNTEALLDAGVVIDSEAGVDFLAAMLAAVTAHRHYDRPLSAIAA